MVTASALINGLNSGEFDEKLLAVYNEYELDDAKSRCNLVASGFFEAFLYSPTMFFSAPGRTELAGNHTDHQRGKVIAAAVNLDILAAVSPNRSGVVRVLSKGMPMITVNLSQLEPDKSEIGTSAALIRGIASQFTTIRFNLADFGFDMYAESRVLVGSGLSSSAAFEVLIATVFNELINNGEYTPLQLAQIGQNAENVFFGKPCGLMDQAACASGGAIFLDFFDANNPRAQQIPVDFSKHNHALCIIDVGASHEGLTDEYASITSELKSICSYFKKDVLSEISEDDFIKNIPLIRELAGDRAILRAFHVFAENKRVDLIQQALMCDDFNSYIKLASESGRSSAMYLQNVVSTGSIKNQELMLIIALAETLLGTEGMVRVHGGGFGGTAQALVPKHLLDKFKQTVEGVLGAGKCHVLSIRAKGSVRLI